jgi:hypothetical protein
MERSEVRPFGCGARLRWADLVLGTVEPRRTPREVRAGDSVQPRALPAPCDEEGARDRCGDPRGDPDRRSPAPGGRARGRARDGREPRGTGAGRPRSAVRAAGRRAPPRRRRGAGDRRRLSAPLEDLDSPARQLLGPAAATETKYADPGKSGCRRRTFRDPRQDLDRADGARRLLREGGGLRGDRGARDHRRARSGRRDDRSDRRAAGDRDPAVRPDPGRIDGGRPRVLRGVAFRAVREGPGEHRGAGWQGQGEAPRVPRGRRRPYRAGGHRGDDGVVRRGGRRFRWEEDAVDRKLMSTSYGPWIIGVIGVGVVIGGLLEFMILAKGKATDKLGMSELGATGRKTVEWISKVGVASRGFVFAVVGVLIVRAAITHDASQASGGSEQALQLIAAEQSWVVLLLVAIGLVCYGLYCFAKGRYRRFSVD